MKSRIVSIGIICVVLSAALVVSAQAQSSNPPSSASPSATVASVGTAFRYQGQLKNGNTPVNGTCDVAFRLYDAASVGAQIGSTLNQVIVITNGLFNSTLDFGASFNSNARWLDMQVRCPQGSGAFTQLSPRQQITPVPNALFTSNADLLDGQDASAFVNLSGAQTINGIKTFTGGMKYPDGTTQTTAFFRPKLPGPGAATAVDTAGDVGRYSSITIGADGLGLISYYELNNYDLKLLHCGNTACNSGNYAVTVNATGMVGAYTSITIGADGSCLVSYSDDVGYLKVLHCSSSIYISGNTNTVVDSAGNVGKHTSITIGADGRGLISYFDTFNGDLKVLHCGNVACNSGNAITTIDSAGDVGLYTSITIGADGLGLISYYDLYNGDLKVLHCGNLACNSGNITTIVDSTGDVGYYTSITIGADSLGLISYLDNTNGDLKVLHCGNTACNSGNSVITVDSVGGVGSDSAITIGADGLGLISYADNTNYTLKVLHCGNVVCNNGNTATTVDSTGGRDTSITIGADGLGLISYYDFVNGDLKVFHCSNVTCTPYTRVGR